ncbi:hypothetical protein GCM10027596_30450 [Nocardioides korecus]
MPYDDRVTALIQAMPAWQGDVGARVRALVHEAVPEVEETVKRTDRPYFVLQGNICALQSTRDHVNVFVYDPVAPDPAGIINQGHGNSTARSIQLYSGDTLPEGPFRDLVAAVAENNRRGGWRRLSRGT